jgi:hypothetical protein
MTEQKKLKRRVRDRMEKTGERYTAARRHIVESDPAAAEPEPDLSGLASDEAVSRNTGRSWAEWFAILDEWGAVERPHREIARYLGAEHGVPGWWAQNVTVGYERARGLRAKYEGPGGFSVGVSRTIAVPVDRLYAAFADDAERERLLPGLSVRTRKPNRTARFDRSSDGTRIVVGFVDKGPEKSTVALQVERLPDAEAVERARAEWRELLAGLKRALET